MNQREVRLRVSLMSILKDHPNIEAKKIRAFLRTQLWAGIRRKEVHSALYKGLADGTFAKDRSKVPQWRVASREVTRHGQNVAERQIGKSRIVQLNRSDGRTAIKSDKRKKSSGGTSADWKIVEVEN